MSGKVCSFDEPSKEYPQAPGTAWSQHPVCMNTVSLLILICRNTIRHRADSHSISRVMTSTSLHSALTVLVCIGLFVLVTGCRSSGAPVPTSTATDRTASAVNRAPASDADWNIEQIETDLRTEARSWEGVPHEWGGTNRNGIDCSALTQVLYARALGLDLPRDTKRQSRVGERVPPQSLQPGDLVFFRPRGQKRHVGVYLSDGDFIHASSSSGVTVSDVRDAYWQRSWWQARRLIPGAATRSPAPPVTSTPSPAESGRAGW